MIVVNFDILRGYWKARESCIVNCLGSKMDKDADWINCLEAELEDFDEENACFREIYQDVTKGKVNEDKLTFIKKNGRL